MFYSYFNNNIIVNYFGHDNCVVKTVRYCDTNGCYQND